MSTKIYNGLKLNVDGFDDLLEKLQGIRTWVKKDTQRRINQMAANMRVNYIDREAMNFNRPDDGNLISSLSRAQMEIERRNREIKKTGRRDPYCDFGFELAILSGGPGVWLAIPYTDYPDWEKHLISRKWVKRYGYWDNTEREERVSAKEWERRRLDWDLALGPLGIPAQNGVTADLSDTYLPFIKAEDALALIPSWEKRVADRVADANSCGAYWHFVASGKDPASFINHLFSSLQDFTKSEEWLSRKDEVRAYVEATLPREITLEMLKG